MTLLGKQVDQLGPMLRLRWEAEGETEPQVKARGTLWLERAVLERLKTGLLPAQRPPTKAHVHPSPCWLWTGPVDGEGKGVIYNQGHAWNINRLLYTIQYGPLSERVLLYSTCGVPRCCNPYHHVALDRGPIRRPVMDLLQRMYPRCRNGHAMTPENTYVFGGKAMCRDCRAAAQARYRRRGGPPPAGERRPPSSGSPSPGFTSEVGPGTGWRPGAANSTG